MLANNVVGHIAILINTSAHTLTSTYSFLTEISPIFWFTFCRNESEAINHIVQKRDTFA